jgi:hypothetical protein
VETHTWNMAQSAGCWSNPGVFRDPYASKCGALKTAELPA